MQDGTYPTRNFATLGPVLTYSRLSLDRREQTASRRSQPSSRIASKGELSLPNKPFSGPAVSKPSSRKPARRGVIIDGIGAPVRGGADPGRAADTKRFPRVLSDGFSGGRKESAPQKPGESPILSISIPSKIF